MRRPWWLFYGVARETERMRYRGPWERWSLALQHVADVYVSAFAPALREITRACNQFAAALGRSRVPVAPHDSAH